MKASLQPLPGEGAFASFVRFLADEEALTARSKQLNDERLLAIKERETADEAITRAKAETEVSDRRLKVAEKAEERVTEATAKAAATHDRTQEALTTLATERTAVDADLKVIAAHEKDMLRREDVARDLASALETETDALSAAQAALAARARIFDDAASWRPERGE